MSVIARLAVPAADFTLGATLTGDTGIRVELERIVPVDGTFIPFLWVSDDDIAKIEASLREESDIEDFEVIDETNGTALVRVQWTEELDGFLDALDATDAVILEGVGEADTWHFHLRFGGHEALTGFYRRCVEEGISVTVDRVHNPGLPRTTETGLGLTDTQRETLRTAFDAGYFDVPRRTNLVELAETMDVSDSAVSQRLRRGVSALLAATLSDVDGNDLDADVSADRHRDLI